MLKNLFAPLQGYTTGIYRKAHAEIFGGVDAYYTPFLRIENGKPREKDLRDLEIANAECANSRCTDIAEENAREIPQIIANSVDEFKILADALIAKGYMEIDFNMGCPFPMQVNRHRGAGILNDKQTVQEIMDEIRKLSSVTNGTAPAMAKVTAPIKFSVKMRLGQDAPDEAFALLPILNEAPLSQITLHPRLGKQQYKGAIDFKSFEKFYEECRHPLVYNGDITTVSQICEMERRYPKLAGVMIGRGLLAKPSLAAEYKGMRDINCAAPLNSNTHQNLLGKLFQMHQVIFDHACKTNQGDSQILSHVQSFWEYLEPSIPKKNFKKIKKAGKLSEYQEAIMEMRGLS
ncbi:tRNA-U20a,U20b-dihydrouridine synthase [Fibrobacter sp. UWB16]|uniref:tRNA-dihydrouridine synthase family protein n=1 Tax=Fibrobacter sp. UWB16 TaxID=1945874 RepID=UPI000BD8E523|nr:tRNA-dihydrouridine synthase family protein [Fibrobacter sp. UWB16]SOD13859.1 tRNA-U20a,U20b-dihydrouridine synthase [Fibrobacter sp. UWB16]